MNVISIGTDKKIFEEGSAVRARMIEYGSLFTELHIIVFSLQSQSLEAWRIADNVWVYPTNSLSRIFYMSDAFKIAKKFIKLRSLNATNTIVTTQDPFETGKVGLKLKNLFHMPLHVQIHTDLFSPYFISGSFKQKFINNIRMSWAKKMLPTADRVRVVSERIKKSLISLLQIEEKKIDVLPIYIDKKELETEAQFNVLQKFPQFNFIILMVCRLEYEKNIFSALRIFQKVLETYPKIGLVIVGSGSLLDSLRTYAQKLHIQDSVSFEGWQTDVVSYAKTAQAFLSTSLYEGYGLALESAGVVGLPIITSDVGIAGDMLVDGKTACICPVNDESCFVSHITKLIEDNAFRQSLIMNSKDEIPKKIITDKQDYLRQYKESIECARNTEKI